MRYDIDIEELARAFEDFDRYVVANGGWNHGEIPIIDSFLDYIAYGKCSLEPRDGE